MTTIHDTADLVSKALRRAWQLGQTYWQQADSEYQSHWKKADATQATFDQLVEDTRAAILTSNSGAQPAPSVPDVPAKSLKPVIDWLRNGCDPMKAADELEILIAAAAGGQAMTIDDSIRMAHEARFPGDSCLRVANLELAGYRKRMREIATSMSVAEQDKINAEAAIRSIYGADADPWPTIARGMLTPAHIAPPCKAPPPPNYLEASIRDTIARFAATDDLAKDAADAVLEIVRPLAERSDRLECALREVKEAVEFTLLGVRGIKALQAARAALEESK